jgi:hypothetical protein
MFDEGTSLLFSQAVNGERLGEIHYGFQLQLTS